MSSYDFIIDGIRFSYSSVSSYQTCPACFKLTYIDAKPRQNNFYAEFGTLVHSCFERFFTGKLEAFELAGYYAEQYEKVIKTPAPAIPVGLGEKYKAQGKEFFDNFQFPREQYDVLFVEDKIDLDIGDIKIVAKPDLVLLNKNTRIVGLYDYKTATPYRIDKRSGKEVADTEKINGYQKQLYLYTYALREKSFIKVDEMVLWYPRLNRMVTTTWNYKEEEKVIDWFKELVKSIRKEENFEQNLASPYFCENLCSVRDFCQKM